MTIIFLVVIVAAPFFPHYKLNKHGEYNSNENFKH